MKKSEKVVDYLIAGGEILTVPAGILAIIGIAFHVAGYKEISLITFIASVTICVVALLILVPPAIAIRISFSKYEKEEKEKKEEMKECEQKLIDDSWVQVSKYEQQNAVTGEMRFGKTVKLEPLKMDLEKEVENMNKIKVEGKWVGTIADDVKKLFDLEINERFIWKNEIREGKYFIDKEGKVVEDFYGINILHDYNIFPIDYKILKILNEERGYYIEKIPNTNNTQVAEYYNKKLKEIVEELEELIKEAMN